MTTHFKIYERLNAYSWDANKAQETPCSDTLDALKREFIGGEWNDILGVENPTFEDVERESVRVFGRGDSPSTVTVYGSGSVGVSAPGSLARHAVLAPSLAAAYAALRALPSREVDK